MKFVLLCLFLISCASRNRFQTCEEKTWITNQTLHWTISANEINIPDTQIFIQKSDKSFEVFTAHFKFSGEDTYRYSPEEGEMSGPETFHMKSEKLLTLIAEIPLKEVPLKTVVPVVCGEI